MATFDRFIKEVDLIENKQEGIQMDLKDFGEYIHKDNDYLERKNRRI